MKRWMCKRKCYHGFSHDQAPRVYTIGDEVLLPDDEKPPWHFKFLADVPDAGVEEKVGG